MVLDLRGRPAGPGVVHGQDGEGTSLGARVQAELLPTRWRDPWVGAALAAVALALMSLVVTGLVVSFYTSPTLWGWALLGLMYCIGSTWTQAVSNLRLIKPHGC